MEVDLMANAAEIIEELSKKLEHSRDLNNLFVQFIDVDKLELPEEVKKIFKQKIQICESDKN